MSPERRVPNHFYRQSGVVPYRLHQGAPEVLLITTASGNRWTIPKGVVEPGLSAVESAAKETEEEAGLIGRVLPAAVGRYAYPKWGGICEVEVFLFEVHEMLESWPESHVRERRWFSPDSATSKVKAEGLRRILHLVPESLHDRGLWEPDTI